MASTAPNRDSKCLKLRALHSKPPPHCPYPKNPTPLSLQELLLPAATYISYIFFTLFYLSISGSPCNLSASKSTHPEIPALLQVLKQNTQPPTLGASSGAEEAIVLEGNPGRGQAGEYSPRADNFLVLMIFAAYSCVEVFFTHLRTTEKAPLEGEEVKNWDMEQSDTNRLHM